MINITFNSHKEFQCLTFSIERNYSSSEEDRIDSDESASDSSFSSDNSSSSSSKSFDSESEAEMASEEDLGIDRVGKAKLNVIPIALPAKG